MPENNPQRTPENANAPPRSEELGRSCGAAIFRCYTADASADSSRVGHDLDESPGGGADWGASMTVEQVAEMVAEIQQDDLDVALAGITDPRIRDKVRDAFLRQFERERAARALASDVD